MFAVQDVYSRLIIHAHLAEIGDYKGGFISRYFPLEKCCLPEALAVSHRLLQDRFIKPTGFISDFFILFHYKNLLKKLDFCTTARASEHPIFLSPLERFFYTTEYEMRSDLTDKNLKDWLIFYNFKRRVTALNGLTPIEKYLNVIPDKKELEHWKESVRKKRIKYQLAYYYRNRKERIAYQLKRYHEHRKELIAYQLRRYYTLKRLKV